MVPVPASGLTPRRAGGPLEVAAPAQARRQVRRTRSWLLLLLLSPVCFLVVLYVSFGTSGPPQPVVHPALLPAGYTAVTDSDFGYAVPAGYRQNPTWTDANGDFFYGTPAAFVAEAMLLPRKPPGPRTAAPAALEAFGRDRPARLTLAAPRRVRVPGTAAAWRYSVTGPGGFTAVALDTWEPATSTQMWLLVHAPAAVTAEVLSSLQGAGTALPASPPGSAP